MHWGSRTGDWVFVNGDYLDQFLNIRLPSGKKFNLVIHNTDIPFDAPRLIKTLPRAFRIYAINTTIRHQQLTTIPLGFPDSGLNHLDAIKPLPVDQRTIEIYSNFLVTTNAPARLDCLNAFKDDPRVVRKEPEGRSQPEYYKDMCNAKYVLCPTGTGIDTHRVYEALACGATPVVLHSTLDHLYQTLPICILTSWTDPFYVPSGTPRFNVNQYI
jgi:hypothetical protein